MATQNYYAVDADILLALADGNECAQGLVDYFMVRKCHPVVTFSVFTHLQDIKENVPECAERAEKALTQCKSLGVLEPSLSETERDLAEMTADELVAKGLVKSTTFAFAIAEAAMFGASYFVTAQHDDAMEVDDKRTNFVLQARGLSNILVISPTFIAEHEQEMSAETGEPEVSPEI